MEMELRVLQPLNQKDLLLGKSLLKSNHSLSPKDTIIQNNNEIHSNKDNLPLNDENETNIQTKINLPTYYYPDSHSDDIDDNSPRYEEFDLDRGSSPKNVNTYSDSGDSPPHKNSYLSKINNIECDSIEKCLSTSNLENLNDMQKMLFNESYEKKIDNFIGSIICTNSNKINTKCSPGQSGTTIIYLRCSDEVLLVDDLAEENKCKESRNKKPNNKKRTRFYLNPNPHLRHFQLNNFRKIKNLPILKNGSRAEEIKSCVVKDFGKTILRNTYVFDSAVSILMVAYYDIINYNTMVDGLNNTFLRFIAEIVKNGISAKTYSTRAEIMVRLYRTNK
ncbi:UCH domain-containing protein [Aphis craccivora]|uniref:UCH domain-containing protein n=1 Tax=Aphis craccivora TaxID=307492 RepID=A0A6G0XRI8_APHCR|nr:UCH domain-containing protein [Aphis craccivora]